MREGERGKRGRGWSWASKVKAPLTYNSLRPWDEREKERAAKHCHHNSVNRSMNHIRLRLVFTIKLHTKVKQSHS